MGVVSGLKVLPYGRQSIDEDDIAAVTEALRGDWLTQGPTVARFEEALCQATGARYAVAVANGTAALHLACLAAGVRAGDVGIAPSITFLATANAVRYAGGTPRLIDVDPSTALLSTDALSRALDQCKASGQRVRVVLPVDMTGAPAPLAEVQRLARQAGALVISDAAHSLGASYDHEGGQTRAGSCTHSDMAILSFHPVKHIATGEGGAITTNDETLYRELLDLRTHGITRDPAKLRRNDGPWYYEQRVLGFNYRITDLQCALGLSQMRKLDRFVARRRELAGRYDRAFAELSSLVRPLRVPVGVHSSYHLYVLTLVPRAGEVVASVAERRRGLFLALREAGIAAQVHYIPIHTQPDYVDHGLAQGDFPGAEAYYAGCISLPLFPAMDDADVDRVVGAVRSGLLSNPLPLLPPPSLHP